MTSDSPDADWRTYEPASLPPVLAAALDAFVEHGYHGTSIRDLARRAGLSVPTLYHYYPSKQATLAALMTTVMNELLERSHAAIEAAGPQPRDQFDALVESLLRFHMFRSQQAFVASTEIRSLDEPDRTTYVSQRDEQQRMLDDIINTGVQTHAFTTPHPRAASRAIATLCVGVATWYRPDGPSTPDELVREHVDLAHALVGAQ